MFDKIKETAAKLGDAANQALGNITQEFEAAKDGCSNEEYFCDIPEADQPRLAAVSKCPYLEEKCSDLPCPCPKYEAWRMIEENPNLINEKIAALGIDPAQESWKVIMGMQKIFAGRFHNTTNMTKEEKDYWIKDYLVCIEDEVGELLDHITLPLSTEETGSNNEELLKEIIDILHFTMDAFIAGEASPEDIKQAYFKHYTVGVKDVDDFLAFAYDNEAMNYIRDENTRMQNRGNQVEYEVQVLDLAARLLRAGKKVRQQISWKHWKKPNATINQEKLMEAYADLFVAFMGLVVTHFESAEQVKEIYIKKNVENILRQELGY